MAITHDALDSTTQRPHGITSLNRDPKPCPLDMFKFIYYEAHTVDKRAVGILHECLLVFSQDATFRAKASSQRAKANAKAKKIKERSEEIKEKNFKHQRKFLLSHSLLLGMNRPLSYNHSERQASSVK